MHYPLIRCRMRALDWYQNQRCYLFINKLDCRFSVYKAPKSVGFVELVDKGLIYKALYKFSCLLYFTHCEARC